MDSIGVCRTRKLRVELRISYIKMQVTFGIRFLQDVFNGVVCLSETLRCFVFETSINILKRNLTKVKDVKYPTPKVSTILSGSVRKYA